MHWSRSPQHATTGEEEFVGPQGTALATVRFPGHWQVILI